eukprot:2558293-Rhodomonas_salina.3
MHSTIAVGATFGPALREVESGTADPIGQPRTSRSNRIAHHIKKKKKKKMLAVQPKNSTTQSPVPEE